MGVNVDEVIRIAKDAGRAILNIYEGEHGVTQKVSPTFKEGESPLTLADTASNDVIQQELKKLYPEIPILSEEIKEESYEVRKDWKEFFLIDPLDGTKEFIKKSGEFTVNIALVSDNQPVMGVVYAPVTGVMYFTRGEQAFRRVGDKEDVLPVDEGQRPFRVVASKSHFSSETQEFVDELKKEHPDLELISAGSSLKLCRVAEGSADIYPRMGLTSEWDTAAAHAVLGKAGKNVYEYSREEKKILGEIRYNKENILNPWFVAK